MNDATLNQAVQYLALGWKLLPLQPGDKLPHTGVLQSVYGAAGWAHLREHALTEDDLAAWRRVAPTAGIGVLTGVCSGIVVVDFDAGAPSQIATPTVNTARGVHLYF